MKVIKNFSLKRKVDLKKLHTHIHREKDFFPGQRENETVKLCVRTHWLRRAAVALNFLGLAILTPTIIVLFFSLFLESEQGWNITRLLLSIYILFVWLFIFIELMKIELTALVVTNERLVDIVQLSLFDQQISEANLNRIQEVTGHTTGMLGTFFGVGKLEIQTAGTEIPLIMPNVKHPHFTARKILDIQKSSNQRQRANDFTKRSTDPIRTRKDEELSPADILKMRKTRPVRKGRRSEGDGVS